MIPKIIHQIWSGLSEPLPEHFRMLGQTWKEHHPDWEYEFWDNARMEAFVLEHYAHLCEGYNAFPHNIQRWDAIRYLILNTYGGMYVDFDYEALEPLDKLLEGHNCCFAQEPESHRKSFKKDLIFNNALMASTPEHPFMKKVIDNVFSDYAYNFPKEPKFSCVLSTTGPWALMRLYEELSDEEKSTVYLIPEKYVTPFDLNQAHRVIKGEESDELEACLEEAVAIHYFFGNWTLNVD